jgi:hypothetical protein
VQEVVRLDGRPGDGKTVWDDKDVDVLTGDGGTDWFWANFADALLALDVFTDHGSRERRR